MNGEAPGRRVRELAEISRRLLRQIPAEDLARILFPPVLAWEVISGALDGGSKKEGDFDPSLPDDEALEAVLDIAGWLARHWFDARVHGEENVPAEGPALLVGNHSAGLMPLDALFAMAAVRRRVPGRVIHPLAHDFAYMAKTTSRHARRLGILRATRENTRDALLAGRVVLVYPGGDREAFRPFSELRRVVLAGRKGFVRIALDLGVPVVPLVSIGLHETFLVLTRGERLAEALGLKRLIRTEVFPIGFSLPWGLGPVFFPFLPLPSPVDVAFGEPIRLEGDPADEAAVEAGYSRIESTMQAMMDDLSRSRGSAAGGEPPRDATRRGG